MKVNRCHGLDSPRLSFQTRAIVPHMDYDQVSAFCAVARCASFRKASEELHKTQPAISKLVRNLEGTLELTLFDRSSYRAKLSDEGKRFYPRALSWLEDSERLRSYARTLSGGQETSVGVAVDAAAPLAPVTCALALVRKAFPEVAVRLRTERLEGALHALLGDEVELALSLAPASRPPNVEHLTLPPVYVVPVVRADHELASLSGKALHTALRRHPQIVLTDSARRPVETSLNVLEGGLRWDVTDLDAKQALIDAGLGWGGIPQLRVAELLNKGRLTVLDVPEFERPELALQLLRRRDRARGPVQEALWKALASAPT